MRTGDSLSVRCSSFPVSSRCRRIVIIYPVSPFIATNMSLKNNKLIEYRLKIIFQELPLNITVKISFAPFWTAPRNFEIVASIVKIILTNETLFSADSSESQSIWKTIINLKIIYCLKFGESRYICKILILPFWP